ncbi:MAG: hypothetical protein R2817_10655 [Flavobacteriales bacterium]
MNHPLPTVALWLAGLLFCPACKQPASPGQLAAVDSLIVANQAALLTLRELDATRFDRLDSLLRIQGPALRQRFQDTLPPAEARILAPLYLGLRDAARMGQDQTILLHRIAERDQRLQLLREDLQLVRISTDKATGIIDHERRAQAFDHEQVLATIANYRRAQQLWEQCDSLGRVLAQADQ